MKKQKEKNKKAPNGAFLTTKDEQCNLMHSFIYVLVIKYVQCTYKTVIVVFIMCYINNVMKNK